MANAQTQRELKVILTLSEEEAIYIRSLCQNDLTPGGSDPLLNEIRENIFKVLTKALGD